MTNTACTIVFSYMTLLSKDDRDQNIAHTQ